MFFLISQQLKAEINLGPCDIPVGTALLDFWNQQTPINVDNQNFRVINGKIIYKNLTPLVSKEISNNKQIYVYKDGQGMKRKVEISSTTDEIIIHKINNTEVTDKIIDARSGKPSSIAEQVFPPNQGHVYYKFKIKNNKCILDQHSDYIVKSNSPQITAVLYDTKYCIQINTLKNEYCANKIECPDIFFKKFKEIYIKRNLELQKESQVLGTGSLDSAVETYASCNSGTWKIIGFDKFLDPILADEIDDGKMKMPNYNTPKKSNI